MVTPIDEGGNLRGDSGWGTSGGGRGDSGWASGSTTVASAAGDDAREGVRSLTVRKLPPHEILVHDGVILFRDVLARQLGLAGPEELSVRLVHEEECVDNQVVLSCPCRLLQAGVIARLPSTIHWEMEGPGEGEALTCMWEGRRRVVGGEDVFQASVPYKRILQFLNEFKDVYDTFDGLGNGAAVYVALAFALPYLQTHFVKAFEDTVLECRRRVAEEGKTLREVVKGLVDGEVLKNMEDRGDAVGAVTAKGIVSLLVNAKTADGIDDDVAKWDYTAILAALAGFSDVRKKLFGRDITPYVITELRHARNHVMHFRPITGWQRRVAASRLCTLLLAVDPGLRDKKVIRTIDELARGRGVEVHALVEESSQLMQQYQAAQPVDAAEDTLQKHFTALSAKLATMERVEDKVDALTVIVNTQLKSIDTKMEDISKRLSPTNPQASLSPPASGNPQDTGMSSEEGSHKLIMSRELTATDAHWHIRGEVIERVISRLQETAAASRTRGGVRVAGAVGIIGLGGAGKTVLAKTIASTKAVRQLFCDAVLFISVGNEDRPGSNLEQDICTCLQNIFSEANLGQVPSITDPGVGQSQVSAAIKDKRCLLILDDVWHLQHLEYLNVVNGGNGSCVLYTARRGLGATEVELPTLNMLDHHEKDVAERIVKSYADVPMETPLPPEVVTRLLCDICDGLPLALALVGTLFQYVFNKDWRLLCQSLMNPLEDLDEASETLRRRYEHKYKSTLFTTMGRSFEWVKDKKYEVHFWRYVWFMALPQHTYIDEDLLIRCWRRHPETDSPRCSPQFSFNFFKDRLLVTEDPFKEKVGYRVHDLQREWVYVHLDKVEGGTERLFRYREDVKQMAEEVDSREGHPKISTSEGSLGAGSGGGGAPASPDYSDRAKYVLKKARALKAR